MCANWLSRVFHSNKTKKLSSSHGEAALTELGAPPPVENRDEEPVYRHHTLEEAMVSVPDDRPGDHDAAPEDVVQKRKCLDDAYAHIKKEEGI